MGSPILITSEYVSGGKGGAGGRLLLPNKYINRCASQFPVVANLVLKESAIVLAYVLREISIEYETWNLGVRNLVAVLDFDVLTLNRLWRECLDERKHNLIEFRCTDLRLTVEIYLLGSFEYLEDTLLGEC